MRNVVAGLLTEPRPADYLARFRGGRELLGNYQAAASRPFAAVERHGGSAFFQELHAQQDKGRQIIWITLRQECQQ
jgi:hypothetical protein